MKNKIPIVEVNRENVQLIFPYIVDMINSSHFIALDLEMSGLGDRQKINSKSVEERYSGLRDAASSRSLLSFGLSCFRKSTKSKPSKLKFKVATFNILTLCAENFVVEPASVKFLIKHGFDFNLQYSKGIVYYPGADRKKSNCKNPLHENDYLRKIFDSILLSRKPIVLHNSLMDLVFIYQHLYGPAPAQLQTFLADLDQMWPNGIYDTKYVADYCARIKASYLEFVFRKCQRENDYHVASTRLSIKFSEIPDQLAKSNYVQWSFCNGWSEKVHTEQLIERLCMSYCLHGYCNSEKCDRIHDVDLFILDEEYKADKKRQKRKNRLEKLKTVNNGNQNTTKADVTDLLQLIDNKKRELEENCNENRPYKKKKNKVAQDHDENPLVVESSASITLNNLSSTKIGSPVLNGCDGSNNISSNGQNSFYQSLHRAGFDAFMTGFSMAYFAMKNYDLSRNLSDEMFNIAEIRNKISLSGKDFYLTVQCSGFAKHSAYHLEKWNKMFNNHEACS